MSEPMLQWFTCTHLPEHLQQVAKPFCTLAVHVTETLPRTPERTVALRKLLEAKDAALRAGATLGEATETMNINKEGD